MRAVKFGMLLACGLPWIAPAYRSPDLGSLRIFPPDNFWHWDVSKYDVHPDSKNLVASVGAALSLHPDFGTVYAGVPWGIPYVVVGAGEPKVNIVYTASGNESDPGPFPIPLNTPIEGGPASPDDRHVISVDKDNHILYELYYSYPKADHWEAASGAKFDLNSNAMRPAGWTSADAAGLAILPGLVRYEELARGEIDHAIRMTIKVSRDAYIFPASHQAGSTASLDVPPMGMRFRLKAGFDTAGFPPAAKVVLTALKKYGTIVADNGGNWYITGAPDERWPDAEIDALKRVHGSDFEAVLSVDAQGRPIYPDAGIVIASPKNPRGQAGSGPGHDLLGRIFARGAPALAILFGSD